MFPSKDDRQPSQDNVTVDVANLATWLDTELRMLEEDFNTFWTSRSLLAALKAELAGIRE